MKMTDLDVSRESLQIELKNFLESWPTVASTERLSLSAEHAKRIAHTEYQLDQLSRRERMHVA